MKDALRCHILEEIYIHSWADAECAHTTDQVRHSNNQYELLDYLQRDACLGETLVDNLKNHFGLSNHELLGGDLVNHKEIDIALDYFILNIDSYCISDAM